MGSAGIPVVQYGRNPSGIGEGTLLSGKAHLTPANPERRRIAGRENRT